ncbi:MAG: hypothetical protein ABW101_16800 [Candidatus Thiodiazotropha sp.]
MVDGGLLDHRGFMHALVTLCRDKSSGTVFYNLESGLSARMVLNHGEICWLAFGELRGVDALQAIREIERGRMSFNPLLKLAIGKQALPTTPEILRTINTREAHSFSTPPQAIASVTATASAEETVSGRTFDRERVFEVVSGEAMEFLGPIAKLLCQDYMKSMGALLSGNEIKKLINAIVQDIGDEEKVRRFKDGVKKRLSQKA